VRPENLDEFGIPKELNLLVSQRLVLHDLRRPQFVATMGHVNARGITRQERSFFHCRVAATDDDQTLVTKRRQRPVAGRTGRNAVAAESFRGFGFAGNAQPLRRCAGGDDQRVSLYDSVFGMQGERPRAEFDFINPFFQKLSSEPLGLFAEFHHQLRTFNPIGKAGVILNVSRDHQLATRCRLPVGVSRSVNQ
jgi:hypothetical protein